MMLASQEENPFHVVCSMPVASLLDGEDESYSDSTELAVALDEETFPNDGMTTEDSALPTAMMNQGEMSKHTLPHTTGDRAPSPMGLRQKDKLTDDLKKECFSLKMRIYFLTETLQSMHPDMMKDELLTEYAELKASLEEARIENSQLFNECQAAYDRVAELEADNQEREKETVDTLAQTDGEMFEDTLKRLGMMENALQQTTQEAKHLALSYQAKDEEVRLLSQNAQMVLEEKEELVAQLETLEARETERKIEIADMKQKLRASQEALDLERKQNLNLERFKELYLEHEEAFVELNQKLVHEQEARRHMDETCAQRDAEIQTLLSDTQALSHESILRKEELDRNAVLIESLNNRIAKQAELMGNASDAALLEDENNALSEQVAQLESQMAMLDQQLSEKDIVYQELTQVLAETEEILEEKEEVIQALKLRAQESRQDETEAILAMEQALKDSEHQKEELARQLEEAETVIGLLQQDMAVNREPSVTDKEINESFTVAMEAVATVSEGIQAEFEPNTVPQPIPVDEDLSDAIRKRYIMELKERNTCLVKVNQKLDHLIPNKLDSGHVKDFLGLKNLIYEKLRLLAMDSKQLRSDHKALQKIASNSEADKQTIRRLQSELDAKANALSDAKKKLKEMKAQFSHVMDSNSAVKKNLYKREAMISEALKRLTLLSESPAKSSIQDLLLDDQP